METRQSYWVEWKLANQVLNGVNVYEYESVMNVERTGSVDRKATVATASTDGQPAGGSEASSPATGRRAVEAKPLLALPAPALDQSSSVMKMIDDVTDKKALVKIYKALKRKLND